MQSETGGDCDVCAMGECALCGSAGRWKRESWPNKPLWALHTVQVFWELRVHVGRANVLRVRRCCKHCDELEYTVLHSASRLTMQRMKAMVRSDGDSSPERVFWSVLVGEKEKKFGTEWERCPKCESAHSVHTKCEERT